MSANLDFVIPATLDTSSLDALHAGMIAAARAHFAKPDAGLPPRIVAAVDLHPPGSPLSAPFRVIRLWGFEYSKEVMSDGLKALFAAHGVRRYTWITEAWMTNSDHRPGPNDTPPSASDDRREGVVALTVEPGRSLFTTLVIKRDWETGSVTLDEEAAGSDATIEGPWSNLL